MSTPAPDDPQDTEVIDTAEDEDFDVTHSRYQITSYRIDYTVDSLVQRIDRKDIYIPSFQRQFIWTFRQASRFVESLLLGLPVPGIFLSKDKEEKLFVVDGQQRLITLHRFYNGYFEARRFLLQGVIEPFEGRSYQSLEEDLRRRLDDSILHATIIQQREPEKDDSSIYHVFERLNTGGTNLTPQEIRASLYHGLFNKLLEKLNNYQPWRNVYGMKSKRAKDEELILRFFALYLDWPNYRRPMAEFLNAFMHRHRNLSPAESAKFQDIFCRSLSLIEECLGKSAFRPVRGLNAAVFDAIMVGIASRLERGPVTDCATLKSRYQTLLANQRFIDAYKSATTDYENIKARLDLAIRAFADVP
jgi:hypothetical protein